VEEIEAVNLFQDITYEFHGEVHEEHGVLKCQLRGGGNRCKPVTY